MRIDPDECRDPDLLAAEVRRLRAVIAAGEPKIADDDRTPHAHATPGQGSVTRNGTVAARETVCPHVRGTVTQYCSLNFTLTDAEREAIECFAREEWTTLRWSKVEEHCDTLRNLLERLHT